MMSPFLLLLQLHLTLQVAVIPAFSVEKGPAIAKSGCIDHCGKLQIPYPFGIGQKCYHDASYEIVCNNSSYPPKAFLQQYRLEVMTIQGIPSDQSNPEGQTLMVRLPAPGNSCITDGRPVQSMDFEGSPYRFSRLDNILVVEGCTGSVLLKNRTSGIEMGCASLCANNSNVTNIDNNNCRGVGCCEASFQQSTFSEYNDLSFYEITLDHRPAQSSSNTCTLAAAFMWRDETEHRRASLSQASTVPVVLQWYGRKQKGRTSHQYDCYNDRISGFVSCYCSESYTGNPYLRHGCRVRSECRKCKYDCFRNSTTNQFYCEKNLSSKRASIIGYSSGVGFVLLILGCYLIYRLVKWRIEVRRKAKYFKRNGGLLLQQQMSSSDGFVKKMTMFTVADLEKATDNFHESRILGQGGQGTVYKGMLMDGSIVAIKKSKNVDEGQSDQFINEVVILSQVNHRNVVKLLGCCLETEVPLLVYEFIPNGTLYQHIHDQIEDFHITWKMRLQIAAESAGALAYLHSSSSAPIYHRDIKSSNILLDEKYRAKVSDFGTSRAISIEQTHVTTCVQGTYGYLDPEYFQSNQFTDKSDVYSFGVVLVELVTGRKPIRPTDCGEWKNLAIEFLSQMGNSCVFDIVDSRVIKEGKEEEFIAVVDLARRCLNMNGKQRPTMKEVAMILDEIKSPNLKAPTSVKGKCVVTEINGSGPSITDMFFSDSGSFSSLSIEVQPLASNTQ